MTYYMSRQIIWATAVMFLVGAAVCYAEEQKAQETAAPPFENAAGGTAAKPPAGGQIEEKQSSGMLTGLVDELHAAIKEERIKTLAEINKERVATLAELEAIAHRVSEASIIKSKQLIDHFFIRAAQFSAGAFIAVALLGLIFFRKRKKPTLTLKGLSI